MRNKFLIWMSIWLSIICLTVPRHGEAVVTTVGRASIGQPANPSAPLMDEEMEYIRVYALSVRNEAVVVVVPPTTIPPPTTTTTRPPAPTISADDDSVWDRLAQCESGGNWSINTGNGYYGGLQFSLSSWRAVGGSGYPHENSRETQIEMGKRLQASGGWGHWPACSRKLGLR